MDQLLCDKVAKQTARDSSVYEYERVHKSAGYFIAKRH